MKVPWKFGGKLQWLLLGVFLLLALAGGGLLVFKRRDFREWRAEDLARQALVAVAAGDLKSAQNKALAAFQISPSSPAVLRASARLNAQTGHPQTFAFYSALLATGKADEEDRLGFIEAALRAGNFEEAEKELARAEWSEAAHPRLLELRAAFQLAHGNVAGAEQLWRERIAVNPEAAEPRIELARLLLRFGNPEAIAEAVDLLEPLARTQAMAARLLLEPGIPAERREREAERIFADPASASADQLLAAEILLQARAERKEELFRELAGRFPPAEPAKFRDFCAWLVGVGDSEAALDRLPLTTALQRKDYFLVWLDAEAALGNWDLIQSVLASRNPPLEPSLVALYQGRAAQERGEPAAAGYYEKAIAQAGRNLDLQLYLAAYFHRSGQLAQSGRVLRLLTLDPAAAFPAYQALLNQYRESGDTPAVLATLREMAGRWPSNAVIQNDLRYLDLLLGTRPAAAILPESRQEFEKNPAQFPFRMTHALALLKTGRSAEALGLFQDSNVQLRQLLPWQKAILAAILQAEAADQVALDVAASIPSGSLSAEERRLLDGIGAPR